jgi:hypothetical protein
MTNLLKSKKRKSRRLLGRSGVFCLVFVHGQVDDFSCLGEGILGEVVEI